MTWSVDWAMDALPPKCPLRLALEKEIAEMAPGQVQPDCSTPPCPWTKLTVRPGEVITVGDFALKYDSRGAIVSLTKASGDVDETERVDNDWASVSNPLALLRYQSVTDATFGNQMRRSYLFRHPVRSLSLSLAGNTCVVNAHCCQPETDLTHLVFNPSSASCKL
jgi:hypothetical protein|eukprot:COSAG02_NODE_9_length_59728_cov_36.104714_73_plen_165_part_00